MKNKYKVKVNWLYMIHIGLGLSCFIMSIINFFGNSFDAGLGYLVVGSGFILFTIMFLNNKPFQYTLKSDKI